MDHQPLTPDERGILLKLARRAVEASAGGLDLPDIDLDALPARLRALGVSFVTLTNPDDSLRGCIGALEASRPLALDVIEHAAAAAVEDHRFRAVRPEEVPGLHIEISILTPPRALTWDDPCELLEMLRPNVDGVILRDNQRRATFLPQVWEKIPDPRAFLNQLCQKMGAPADLWKRKKLLVEVYQVEEFHEPT